MGSFTMGLAGGSVGQIDVPKKKIEIIRSLTTVSNLKWDIERGGKNNIIFVYAFIFYIFDA